MTTKIRHDELFRKALENKIVAREFFESHLPENVSSILSYETLKIEKDSFVEQNLKNSISDVLFSAKFKNEDGYLYLLLKHQSTPDYFMAFRLFKYMFNILERHITKNPKTKKLPFIYPLVFYNGQRTYNAPRNLWELFEHNELIKNTWINDYQLINVHDIPDEELKKRAWSGILQFFMKHIHERDLFKRWKEVADLLPHFAKVNVGINYIELILCYTLTKIKQSDIIEVEEILKSKLNPEQREEIMESIAHHWEK
ncbi:MAG: Rpn family recombination-promoting nuclease/putative transposase [Rickettsia endosymbiont of Argas persicus]